MSRINRARFASLARINDQGSALISTAGQVSGGVAGRSRERRPVNRREHQEAVALMQRVRLAMHQLPDLKWFHAIPNGGHRNKIAAGKLKAEGVKPGVPDYSLPVRRGDCPGLIIELKAYGGRASKEQKEWLDHYSRQGWEAHVCEGWEAAWSVLFGYLMRGK